MKSVIFLVGAALLFTSCSRKSEKEYYDDAVTAYGNKDYPGAIALFEQAIDRAPKSAYAESSQYRIALVYSNDMHEVRKSMEAFNRFRELFPTSKEAPTALFLIAYFYNNELHHIDSAKLMYEEFLRRYPDDKLATSARFELESLGKDPMHVLQSQASTEKQPPSPPGKKAKSK